MGNTVLAQSQLSLEYVLIPVKATQAGAAYNPSADVVQFAFMPTPTQLPGTADWVSGSWIAVPSNVQYPYSARCLVGPGGAAVLGTGTYVIYVKITDNPEIPVGIPGYLQIT